MMEMKGNSRKRASLNEAKVQEARSSFLAGGNPNLDCLRPEIVQSWFRCRELGVDPHTRAAMLDLPRGEGRRLKSLDLFAGTTEPIFEFLCSVLDGPFVVTATDAYGKLHAIAGETDTVSEARNLNSLVGTDWSESRVGTEASSLSATLSTPSTVRWSEHYCDLFNDWVTNGAPITDPQSGLVVGILGVHWLEEERSSDTLSVLIKATQMMEALLKSDARARSIALSVAFQSWQRDNQEKSGVCFLDDGSAVQATPELLTSLAIGGDAFVCDVSELEIAAEFDDMSLQAAESVICSVRISDELKNHRTYENCDIHGLGEHRGKPAGYVAVIENSVNTAVSQSVTETSWLAKYTFGDVVGNDEQLRFAIKTAKKVMDSSVLPVLLVGETGTGKELVAQSMHAHSGRSDRPFVAVNCAAVDDLSLDRYLFGDSNSADVENNLSVKGSLVLADGGTLFLDDVDKMSLAMQGKLARVIEDGLVLPVGSNTPLKIDVRYIASTTLKPEELVTSSLTPAIIHRLAAHVINLPSLRERDPKDIASLVRYFLHRYGGTTSISSKAIALLEGYEWPGNIRELRNVLSRSIQMCGGTRIESQHIKNAMSVFPAVDRSVGFLTEDDHNLTLDSAERDLITRVLQKNGGSVSKAAYELGVHQTTFYRKLKKHDITTAVTVE